ncbi:MAG: Holliday junction resolvase RuvX [Candidatus Paceibacterota bacterium]
MKYLGIDYGTKKVGFAFSDDEGKVAFPDEVIPNTGDLIKQTQQKIQERKVDEVVVGKSQTLQQKDNPVMKEIKIFVKNLKSKTDASIHFEPEFYTTVQARRTRSNTTHLDASAAALILQSFLDRRGKEK